MYADDVLLLSESKEGLRECLDKLFAYNKKWRLTTTKKVEKQRNIKCNNTLLEETNEYKYLGTIINKTTSIVEL